MSSKTPEVGPAASLGQAVGQLVHMIKDAESACPTCMTLLPRTFVPLNSASDVPGQPLMLLRMRPTNVSVSIGMDTLTGT
jgi:hypothetical protein